MKIPDSPAFCDNQHRKLLWHMGGMDFNHGRDEPSDTAAGLRVRGPADRVWWMMGWAAACAATMEAAAASGSARDMQELKEFQLKATCKYMRRREP